MKRKISASPAALVREIEELQEASSANLKERWRALYRSEPPRRISRELLRRAIAYRLQELALGGLKPATSLYGRDHEIRARTVLAVI